MKKLIVGCLVLGLAVVAMASPDQASAYYKKKTAYAAPRKASYRAHVYAERPAAVGGWTMVANPEGRILLTWDERNGATCHIIYTEANQTWYKYSTAASCAQGRLVVGGLTPGVRYKFRVSPDHNGWSSEQLSARAVATPWPIQ
jgi:hypothetical protein